MVNSYGSFHIIHMPTSGPTDIVCPFVALNAGEEEPLAVVVQLEHKGTMATRGRRA